MSNVELANWTVKPRGRSSTAAAASTGTIWNSAAPPDSAFQSRLMASRGQEWRVAPEKSPLPHGLTLASDAPGDFAVPEPSPDPVTGQPAPAAVQLPSAAADQAINPAVVDQPMTGPAEASAPTERQRVEPSIDHAATAPAEVPAPVEAPVPFGLVEDDPMVDGSGFVPLEAIAPAEPPATTEPPMPIELKTAEPVVDQSAIAPVPVDLPTVEPVVDQSTIAAVEAPVPIEPEDADPIVDRSAFAPIKAPASFYARTADPVADQPPFAAFEWPSPADEPDDDDMPVQAFRLPPVNMHLAGGLAVLATALIAPLLIDDSPDTAGTEVSSAIPARMPTAGLPVGKATSTSLDRGGNKSAQAPSNTMTTASRTAPAETPKASPDEPLPPPLLAARVPDRRSDRVSTVTERPPRPQAGISTAGVPSLASNSSNAASAIPGPSAPVALPPAPDPAPVVIARNDQRPVVRDKPARLTPAQLIGGELRNSDNKGGRFQGSVGISLTVRADGRIGGCRVTGSSGNPNLDSTTCRLASQRLKFNPARDSLGRPIESEVSTSYTWGRRVGR